MGNKLVYVSGVAYWMLPDGNFIAAEMKNGVPVENVAVRPKRQR